VMVSDWLELDASDSWVRHDSEIVSICPTRPPSVPQSPHTFRDPRRITAAECRFHQALQQELSYASYLDVPTVIFPPPRNRRQIAAYGRAVNTCLARTPYMQISIRLPIYDPSIFQVNSPTRSSTGLPRDKLPSGSPPPSSPTTPIRPPESRAAPSTKASEAELTATWEMWDAIRSICAYNPRLTLSTCFGCGWRLGLYLTTFFAV